jgi:hypothetical protein
VPWPRRRACCRRRRRPDQLAGGTDGRIHVTATWH